MNNIIKNLIERLSNINNIDDKIENKLKEIDELLTLIESYSLNSKPNVNNTNEFTFNSSIEGMIYPMPKNINKEPVKRKDNFTIFNFSKFFENYIVGGLADKKKEKDFDSEQLKIGIEIEMEHTNNKSIAKEIAMDHLTEDPKYYFKLKKYIENKKEL